MSSREHAVNDMPVVATDVRILVSALGEVTRPPWWRTSFLNETGLRFLERLYPRSVFSAALHAAGRAACRVHDLAIGRTGVHHLFRLPESIENQLREFVTNAEAGFQSSLRSDLGSVKHLLTRLKELTVPTVAASPGPQRIGSASALGDSDTYRRIGAVYYQAFERGYQAFPYVEVD